MEPIILQGQSAFSDFRSRSLIESLSEAGVTAESVDAVWVYFLEADQSPDAQTMERSYSLLDATSPFDRKGGFFVTPRKGTISPWSTKASDIFHNCGLSAIHRVEHGIHYRLLDDSGILISTAELGPALHLLHDRMTEAVYCDVSDFFRQFEPAPLRTVPFLEEGPSAFHKANLDWGLALSDPEVDYLVAAYEKMQRNPTDAELFMFSQVNSEHCRHKIFNAEWTVDGDTSELSLFDMIRNTHKLHPEGTRIAYSDNSGVLDGHEAKWFEPDQLDGSHTYQHTPATLDILCKVETHNHPTAISPFPGAATGVGGEIRDEGATGIGGRSKAGLSAFITSHLRLVGYSQPWERDFAPFPTRLATPLEIMLEGPIGGAAFGNEFGRPQLCGLFRTMETEHNGTYRGYHKPIMAAGGMGNLKRHHVDKHDIPPTALIIQLGGPSMKIGLGGGAASSIGAGSQSEALDFDSVQRGNPEMQRRCQQVIDGCIALAEQNPILSIHDIGAGGLSNGLPELVEATGGKFHLRKVHSEDKSLSPMEIWCNESQERYVMAIMPDQLDRFTELCSRERCPFAVVGEATDDNRLVVEDSHFDNLPIDMEMGVLLGKTPRMRRDVKRTPSNPQPLNLDGVDLADALERVMAFPAVANKTFLISIADRTITGMVHRDQMVGPWQTPVADCAVTTTSLDTTTGEAMALGERTPLAMIDAAASGRMAIGECLTNIASTKVDQIGNVKLSANWMVAAGQPGEDANLFDTVRAVGMELCPALGISIPVGKDSMSMSTSWRDGDGEMQRQVSPLSLLVTGFSPVSDVRLGVTPDLKKVGNTLLLLDLADGEVRLGGSVLAQVYNQVGDETPDLDSPEIMRGFFAAFQDLLEQGIIASYHDRSDGGLLACVAEMAIAGRTGVELNLVTENLLGTLFAEELGAVIEVAPEDLKLVQDTLAKHGVINISHEIGTVTAGTEFVIKSNETTAFSTSVLDLHKVWSELSFRMQSLRDNPSCAEEEYAPVEDPQRSRIISAPSFDPDQRVNIIEGAKPKVAILREQGINGHNEMAAAFDRAGFAAVDVHMTDLLSGTKSLGDFYGLVACGGFSYGDVLGAGSGWAKSVLYNAKLQDGFAEFFNRDETLTLGVCNGCQMISQLKSIIPGAEEWPEFVRNRSEQFEARYVNVEVLESPSIFLNEMEGSILPIPVAHGEGRADFSHTGSLESLQDKDLISMRYVDGKGEPAMLYPANPNGSTHGITGFTTPDGRVTIMMPHPERLFRSVQMSYRPADQFTGEAGPWLRMFENAYRFVK